MADFEVFGSLDGSNYVVGMSLAGDYALDTLSPFSSTIGASLSSSYQSSAQIISGLGYGIGASLEVSGGTLVVNDVNVGTSGLVVNGDSVRLANTSSGSYLTTLTTTLSSGGVEISRWDLTTYAQPIDLSPGDNYSGSDLLYNLIRAGTPLQWW